MATFDHTADTPQPFGFKISWFAVKASDPASVLNALEFGDATPANWASGLAAAYGDPQSSDAWVFVSPAINGWILVVGASLPYPTIETHDDNGKRFDVLLARLMKRFDDVQFFGSHRVVEFAAWARARRGKTPRIFAYLGEIGEVLANVGEQTPEEAELGFTKLSGLSPPEATERIFAIAEEQTAKVDELVASGLSRREARERVRQKGRDGVPGERDVVELAAVWSIDPTRLSNQDHPGDLGLAAPLPKNLMQ
jgi:hypothetical protein